MTSHRPIRVLMVTATLGYGGAESSFARLADFLSRYADISIAVMALDYGNAAYSSQQSSTTHRLLVLDENRDFGAGLIGKVQRWWHMLRQLRTLKSEHDVTISFLSGPNLLNALSGKSKATIVSERGSKLHHTGISALRKFLWLRILDPLTYRLSGKIVPASDGYAKEILQIAGPRQANKIVPIEGGIDMNALLSNSDAEADQDIVNFCSGPTAVYCGRLDRGKGIDLLLPCFSRLRVEQPEARLLLIGDGPLVEQIVEQCKSLELSVTTDGDPSAAIFLAGYRADPIRNFRLCHLYLFPSLHEGLGNALIEGVASGIPVIASDCPWGPRSIMTGIQDKLMDDPVRKSHQVFNGMLLPVPVGQANLTIWEDEIRRVLREPRKRRSQLECSQAIQRFDINQTGKHWIKLINDALPEGVEMIQNGR